MPFTNNEDNGLRFKSLKVKTGPVRTIRQITFYPVWGEAILNDSLSFITIFYPFYSHIQTGDRNLTSSVGMEYMRQSVDYTEPIVLSYFHNPNNSFIPINGKPDLVDKNITVPGINWFVVQGPHGLIATIADMPDIGLNQYLFYNDSSGANQFDTGDMIAYGECGIEVFGDATHPIFGTYVLETWMYYLGPEMPSDIGDILAEDYQHPLQPVITYKSHVIPVELATFYAVPASDKIRLVWLTASESNNYGFNVERKNRTEDWQHIGFVPGTGTSASSNRYEYVDDGLEPDVYLYRLKQTDINGRSCYSDPLEVRLAVANDFTLMQNYPNPFNPTTEIAFTLSRSGRDVDLVIFNLAGQEIRALVNGRLEPGMHKVLWDGTDHAGRDVPSGVYIYKLRSGNQTSFKKMLKLD